MALFHRQGRTFATLRSLRGLSLAECAAAAGVEASRIAAAERGEITPAVRARLASLYGLDERSIGHGEAVPTEGEGMTVFLLHSAHQDFDAADLSVFESALQAARAYGTTLAGREANARRTRFVPVAPAGPRSRDAAQQGYRLARQVRATLGLAGEPVGDVRHLLEARFGVPVLVGSLLTTDLRAASAVDVGRASAAAVLAHDDESRARNPRLARVYLAHELCHVLFDPASAGCVQVALDERPQQGGASGTGTLALLESRAKGFAAELLIPSLGARALVGAPRAVSGLSAAREIVERVVARFLTPWRIAVFHLGNLGFIDLELAGELAEDPTTRGDEGETELPEPGATPICLREEPDATSAWQNVDVLASEAPAFVATSREVASSVARERERVAAEALERAYAEVAADRPLAATDALLDHLDKALSAGDTASACAVLDRLDASRLSPNVLTGVLSLSWHAREVLGGAHERAFERAMAALESTWKLPPERRERIAARLR